MEFSDADTQPLIVDKPEDDFEADCKLIFRFGKYQWLHVCMAGCHICKTSGPGKTRAVCNHIMQDGCKLDLMSQTSWRHNSKQASKGLKSTHKTVSRFMGASSDAVTSARPGSLQVMSTQSCHPSHQQVCDNVNSSLPATQLSWQFILSYWFQSLALTAQVTSTSSTACFRVLQEGVRRTLRQ